MANIPKPELEQGAYICYANEPDTNVDNAGSGGGGVVFLPMDPTDESPFFLPKFSFNQVKNAFESGSLPVVKEVLSEETTDVALVYVQAFDANAEDNTYNVTLGVGSGEMSLTANDPDEFMSINTN